MNLALALAVLMMITGETGPATAPRELPASGAGTSSRLAEIAILSAEKKIEAAAARPNPPSLSLPRLLLDRARRAFRERRFEDAWNFAREASRAAESATEERIERTEVEPAVPDRLFDLESRIAAYQNVHGETDWRAAAAEDLLFVARSAQRRGDLDEAIRMSDRGLGLLVESLALETAPAKIDLARATRIDLGRIPGMTPERIQNLIWFREWIGLRSLSEVVFIPGFDEAFVVELLPYVTVSGTPPGVLEFRIE